VLPWTTRLTVESDFLAERATCVSVTPRMRSASRTCAPVQSERLIIGDPSSRNDCVTRAAGNALALHLTAELAELLEVGLLVGNPTATVRHLDDTRASSKLDDRTLYRSEVRRADEWRVARRARC
jgi:hypothetical protein